MSIFHLAWTPRGEIHTCVATQYLHLQVQVLGVHAEWEFFCSPTSYERLNRFLPPFLPR